MALVFKNNYDYEKYEDKFGQFAKKRETAMKSIQKETALLQVSKTIDKFALRISSHLPKSDSFLIELCKGKLTKIEPLIFV